jgi:hypothetical protein
VLAEALTAARSIPIETFRSQALAELAPQLSEGLLVEALTAARSIGNEGDRSKLLAALAPGLAALPRAILSPLWDDLLSSRTRPALLSDLTALAPVLVALSATSPTELLEITRAITDVARWWP